jgi:hypothetical protein
VAAEPPDRSNNPQGHNDRQNEEGHEDIKQHLPRPFAHSSAGQDRAIPRMRAGSCNTIVDSVEAGPSNIRPRRLMRRNCGERCVGPYLFVVQTGSILKRCSSRGPGPSLRPIPSRKYRRPSRVDIYARNSATWSVAHSKKVRGGAPVSSPTVDVTNAG